MLNFNFHHHDKSLTSGTYNLNLQEPPPFGFFSIGIHPKDIDGYVENNFLRLQKISIQENCFAIGECGLDGMINIDEKTQEKVFEKQILWANEIGKPMIIHCVKRFSELIRFKKIAKVPMVIHGFNKKKSIADDLLKHDFYFSFGNALLHHVSLQETMKTIPMEKIFLETDDKNIDVKEIYKTVASLKSLDLETVENQIIKNLETIKNG